MPFYNSQRRAERLAETVDAISMMETIIEQHPLHLIIIGGDINSEMRGDSPFDPYWQDLMTKNHLTCCDSFLPPSSVTYHHKSLDQKKWSDHFIVTTALIDGALLSNHSILEDGDY